MDKGEEAASQATQSLTVKLNEAYSAMAKISSFRFNLLIYNLVTKGHISKAVAAKEAGVDESTIYRIIDKVDQELQT